MNEERKPRSITELLGMRTEEEAEEFRAAFEASAAEINEPCYTDGCYVPSVGYCHMCRRGGCIYHLDKDNEGRYICSNCKEVVVEQVVVPYQLFAEKRLGSPEKWFYICLLKACQEKGFLKGTFVEIGEATFQIGPVSDMLVSLRMRKFITMQEVGKTKHKVPRVILKITIAEYPE